MSYRASSKKAVQRTSRPAKHHILFAECSTGIDRHVPYVVNLRCFTIDGMCSRWSCLTVIIADSQTTPRASGTFRPSLLPGSFLLQTLLFSLPTDHIMIRSFFHLGDDLHDANPVGLRKHIVSTDQIGAVTINATLSKYQTTEVFSVALPASPAAKQVPHIS